MDCFEEAQADLTTFCGTTGTRDLKEYAYRVAHFARFFAGRRLAGIGPQDVTAYTVQPQGEGTSNAAVRRELGTLTRMLRLADENGRLLQLPAGARA